MVQCVCMFGCVHACACAYTSYIAVLLSEKHYFDALHVGAPVQQVDCFVQVILTSQRDGQLPRHTHTHKINNTQKQTHAERKLLDMC